MLLIHIAIYVSSYYRVSSYYCICLILLYMCPHTTLLHMCPHTSVCVRILVYVCADTPGSTARHVFGKTYAHVCSRMLTYAHVCSRMQRHGTCSARRYGFRAISSVWGSGREEGLTSTTYRCAGPSASSELSAAPVCVSALKKLLVYEAVSSHPANRAPHPSLSPRHEA